MSDTFWILVLAVVVLFAFFVALGAFAPGDVVRLSLAVARRSRCCGRPTRCGRPVTSDGRDPRAIRNRERRGF